MDKMIDDAASELDPEKRAEMYHEIQKKAMEELPVIFAIEHPFIVMFQSNETSIFSYGIKIGYPFCVRVGFDPKRDRN